MVDHLLGKQAPERASGFKSPSLRQLLGNEKVGKAILII